MKRLTYAGVVMALASGVVLLLGSGMPRQAVAGSATDLVNAVCSRVASCAQEDAKFRKKIGPQLQKTAKCANELQGTKGTGLWARFGLKDHAGVLKGPDIEAMVNGGELLVSQTHLGQCVAEIATYNCGVIGENITKELTSPEQLIPEKGACSRVYAKVVPSGSTVGQLIESLCGTYANCQKGATSPAAAKEQCVAELNSTAGKSLWDEFGLKRMKGQFTATELEQRIGSRDVVVDGDDFNKCRARIPNIKCKVFDKYVTTGNFAALERIVRKAPCNHALRSTR